MSSDPVALSITRRVSSLKNFEGKKKKNKIVSLSRARENLLQLVLCVLATPGNHFMGHG